MSELPVAVEFSEKIMEKAKSEESFFIKLLEADPSYKAKMLYIKEIEANPDIPPTMKIALLHDYKSSIKAIKNRYKIYNYADIMLIDKGISLEEKQKNIDDEWWNLFNDIAKNVSSEGMQAIWGKILAGECENNNSVSKRLLQVMQAMDNDYAKIFSYMCSHTLFFECEQGSIPVFLQTPEFDCYDSDLMNFRIREELSSIGLITHNLASSYCIVSKEANISYNEKTIHIISENDSISIGTVSYTSSGMELINILYNDLKDNQDSTFIDSVADFYRKNKYNVS